MTPQALRNSILERAVEGKLVEQREDEGTAEELYQKIQAEKKRLIQEGKLKKGKPLPAIAEDEIPFEIPGSWKWVRLGDVSDYSNVKRKTKPKDIDPNTWALDLEDIEKDTGAILNKNAIRNKNIKGERVIFDKGQILYSKLRPYLKKVLVAPDSGVCTPELVPFSCFHGIHSEFLVCLLKSPFIDSTINLATYGVKMPRVGTETMENLLLPLPPLAEQQRIVEKIEELMPFVEAYERDWQKLEDLNRTFPEEMKKSILQEAIRGRLVEQREEEGTAEELYQEIQEEKKRLIEEGKIKKGKPLPAIVEDEIPFEIPESWKWVRLQEIVYNHGQRKPTETFSYIDIGSIDNLRQKLNDEENILKPEKAPSRARRIVKKGDILYSTVRPYLHNMCIIDRDFLFTPIASTGFAVMSCYSGVYNKFLFYYLLSPSFDSYANSRENAKGVAYPAINDARLYKALIPLPPLSEQERIVERIEELLSLCDGLGGLQA